MPSPKTRRPPRGGPKSARTRKRILDAGASALRRDGYAAVTLNDIAALAQLKAGSLYYHFSSKEEIVEKVLELGVAGISAATREAVDALGPGADPLARLRVAIAAHLKFVVSESDYAVANIRILSQVPREIRARHLRRQRRYGAFWRALFEGAARAGRLRVDLDLSVVRMLVLGALNWSVEWYDATAPRSPGAVAAHLSTIVLEGLEPRSRPGAASRRRGRGRAR